MPSSITTNSPSRSCCGRTSSHPAVVRELDNCTHYIDPVFNDVVNLSTVPSASPGIGFASSRWKRLMYYYLDIIMFNDITIIFNNSLRACLNMLLIIYVS